MSEADEKPKPFRLLPAVDVKRRLIGDMEHVPGPNRV